MPASRPSSVKEESTVTLRDGSRSHAVAEGSGPWLVFSHSLACDHRMWNPQADHFAANFRVLRFDTRGHGRSEPGGGPYSIAMLSDDLLEVMDAFSIDRAAVVGLSLGGLIAQQFAARHGDRVGGLVLADTTAVYPQAMQAMWANRIETSRRDGMEPLVEGTVERWFTAGFRTREPAVVESVASMICSTSIEGYAGCCAALAQADLRPLLRSISSPTLVVVGEHDQATSPAMARAISDAISGAEMQVIADAAHLSSVEQPALFNRAIDGFLARLDWRG